MRYDSTTLNSKQVRLVIMLGECIESISVFDFLLLDFGSLGCTTKHTITTDEKIRDSYLQAGFRFQILDSIFVSGTLVEQTLLVRFLVLCIS